MTTRLNVSGMTCGHCKATVEKALLDVQGVERAEVDLESGLVSVDHSEAVTEQALSSAVSEAGYSVTGSQS